MVSVSKFPCNVTISTNNVHNFLSRNMTNIDQMALNRKHFVGARFSTLFLESIQFSFAAHHRIRGVHVDCGIMENTFPYHKLNERLQHNVNQRPVHKVQSQMNLMDLINSSKDPCISDTCCSHNTLVVLLSDVPIHNARRVDRT